ALPISCSHASAYGSGSSSGAPSGPHRSPNDQAAKPRRGTPSAVVMGWTPPSAARSCHTRRTHRRPRGLDSPLREEPRYRGLDGTNFRISDILGLNERMMTDELCQ